MTLQEKTFINSVRADLVNNAKLRLKNGVDANVIDGHGNVAIMSVRSVEMLNLLLENGANLNAKNRNMDSVLTVWVKRLDREKWGTTQFPPLTSSEFLALWDVVRRKDIDSLTVNLDGKTAKAYLNMQDDNQRLIAGKLIGHEGRLRIRQGAEKRAAEALAKTGSKESVKAK